MIGKKNKNPAYTAFSLEIDFKAYSELTQTSKMELFAEIVKG